MDNPSTIPSQLSPIDTMPSGLGPVASESRRLEPAAGTPMLKWLALTAVVVLVAYFAK